MKRLAAITLSACAVFGVAACNNDGQGSGNSSSNMPTSTEMTSDMKKDMKKDMKSSDSMTSSAN